MRSSLFRSTAGALAVAAAGLLVSQSAVAQGGPPATDGWSFRLGAAALMVPDYQGSDEYELKAVPDVEITYSDWFFFNRDGLGVRQTRGPFTAGLAIAYDGGRDEDENSALRGLGDIDGTAEIKLLGAYTADRFTLTASLGRDLLGDGHDGTVATIAASYALVRSRDLLLFAGPSLTWADDNYMSTYFGIDSAQAARSGRAAFDAGAGFKDVGLSVIAIRPLDGGWALTGIAGYSRLLGDAADSPLVDGDGSANQFIGGLGLSYRF